MAIETISLPFYATNYLQRIKNKQRVELILKALFEFLAGISAITGLNGLYAIFGIKLAIVSTLTLGPILFLATFGFSVIVGMLWMINRVQQYQFKLKDELNLIHSCDALYEKIKSKELELSVTRQKVSEHKDILKQLSDEGVLLHKLSDYKSIIMTEPPLTELSSQANRFGEGVMAFISRFNSSLGISLLILGSVGLVPLVFTLTGWAFIAGAAALALATGATAAACDVYFKKRQKFRRKQLERKISDLKELNHEMKTELLTYKNFELTAKNKKLKYENKLLKLQTCSSRDFPLQALDEASSRSVRKAYGH